MFRRNKLIKLTFLVAIIQPTISTAQNAPAHLPSVSDKSVISPINTQASLTQQGEEYKNNLSLSKIVESLVGNKQNEGKNKSDNNSSPTKSDDNSSIMYSDEEARKIKEAFDAFKNNMPLNFGDSTAPQEVRSTQDNEKAYVYLGSILYQSKNNWSIWINDQKITADNNKASNELYIKKINEDKAHVVWTMSISKWKILSGKEDEKDAPINANNQVELNFILSFNQTYILNANKVVEGRAVASKEQIAKPEQSGISNVFNKILKK